jgi:hypothetical protein
VKHKYPFVSMNNLFSLIRRLWHHNYRPILLTLAITTLIWVLALTQPHRLTEGVWTLKLAGCNLDYHTPIHAVALACPGVDYIRLWPLPWSSRGRRRLIQIGCRVGMRGGEVPPEEGGIFGFARKSLEFS